jgi:hypothetical protein
VTRALLIITPVSGLANNTTLGLTISATTTGFDHLSANLADTFRALELSTCKRYITLSPTLYV